MRNNINHNDSFSSRFSNRLPVGSYIDLEESEEEEEEEEELNMDLVCPYCNEGFDALGLCVHLEDQHPLEVKLGVCPLCSSNLGKNMISHLIIQHQSVLKQGLCKRKLHDDDSLVSLLRKKLQEHSRTLQKESASVTSFTNSATDPLFSFVNNSPQSHKPRVDSSAERTNSSKILPNYEILQSNSDSDIPTGFLSSEDHEEKAQKSDFMQTILFSTIFTDNL